MNKGREKLPSNHKHVPLTSLLMNASWMNVWYPKMIYSPGHIHEGLLHWPQTLYHGNIDRHSYADVTLSNLMSYERYISYHGNLIIFTICSAGRNNTKYQSCALLAHFRRESIVTRGFLAQRVSDVKSVATKLRRHDQTSLTRHHDMNHGLIC